VRLQSTGGVPLPPATTPTQVNGNPTNTQPSRRRRPRKLNSQPDASTPAGSAGNANSKGNTSGINVEVQALKSKVIQIEAQVQQILQRPAQAPPKPPRRRQRHQKPQEDTPEESVPQPEPEPEPQNGELERLQAELETARAELANLRVRNDNAKRPSVTRSSSQEDEDEVEEIPRLHGPGVERVPRPRPLGRAVTLSGSYRIPLPATVSDEDLKAIQKGISSAQNLARGFLDERQRERKLIGEERGMFLSISLLYLSIPCSPLLPYCFA
jgi:hypothetical protein